MLNQRRLCVFILYFLQINDFSSGTKNDNFLDGLLGNESPVVYILSNEIPKRRPLTNHKRSHEYRHLDTSDEDKTFNLFTVLRDPNSIKQKENSDFLKGFLNDDPHLQFLSLDGTPNRQMRNLDFSHDRDDVIRNVSDILDDDKAYNLFSVLKTVQRNEPLEAEVYDKFELTKEMLRPALRRRCKKLKQCKKQCVIKVSCTYACKKTYDVEELCEEPRRPLCKRPKCGRTMPPRWLK